MLILGLIVFGLMAGAIAQLVLGRSGWKINWTMALVTGLIGSFVGGLLISLLTGDGLKLAYQWWQKRSAGTSKTA